MNNLFLYFVTFIWSWQHITQSLSHTVSDIISHIPAIFGCASIASARGQCSSIAANFPLCAASQLPAPGSQLSAPGSRPNGETFNGVAAAGEYFPDLEQRAAAVKVWTKHNPILADEPFHISWSFSQHTNKCLAGRFYIAVDIAICTQW